MILSTSFFRLSTMKFFFLRLDRFIQFLYTSSVIISLEFVFSNLRLTVSENLLPLSVQESPNLFVFRVFVSEFRDLARDLCHGKQRVSPFYHDSLTTTTDKRHAFFFRVIGSSSARIEERLTDSVVIVVEVFRNRCSVTDS